MRVPHVINKNTLEVYIPSAETTQLRGEEVRTIIPEDFNWDKELCPSLVTLCIKTIAKNFKDKPILDELPCADRDHLLEILPTDLPLELVVPLIENEIYWQRRYSDKYGTATQRKSTDWTWKSVFLERHIQDVLEQAQPQYDDEENMEEIIKLCNPYVHRITVTQLQSWKPPLTWEKNDIPKIWPIDHINFEPILIKFDNIVEVDVVFQMKEVGTDYTWNMFKLSAIDCRHLSKALQYQKNLQIFKLHRSAIDDTLARVLMQNIAKLKAIVELDLSHCVIGDQGALCIAKVLLLQQTLQKLVLTNNRIGETGALGLGFALLEDSCCPLIHLDLSLNPLEHTGTMGILRALVRGNKPSELSLAGCMFEDETALRLAQMVRLNSSLISLNVCNNFFDDAASLELLSAMKTNKVIHWIDLRDTDIPPEILEGINKALVRNRLGLDEIAEEVSIVEASVVDEEQVETEEKEIVVNFPDEKAIDADFPEEPARTMSAEEN